MTDQQLSPNDRPDLAPRPAARQEAIRRRSIKIVFAIVLALIAAKASADPPSLHDDPSLHYDWYDPQAERPTKHAQAVLDPGVVDGGRVQPATDPSRRPAYVELTACLANFDSDADPDGWRVRLVIRDRDDRPLTVRSQAGFELMPRISTIDPTHDLDAQREPLRWSRSLKFDAGGVASLVLPLPKRLRPTFGWSGAVDSLSGMRRSHPVSRPTVRRPNPFGPTEWTTDPRQSIGMPSWGEFRVRVSIPSHGVFDASTPVRIRPSALVDTPWPYR